MPICLFCTTPPGSLGAALLRSRCRCGYELRYHGLGAPHPFAVVGCAGFRPRETGCQEVPGEPAGQLTFLGETSPKQATLF